MDTYSKGLHDVGGGCYAWLQPDGGWGWSNAGVITGSGASVLVDTLFDLATTGEMIDGIAGITNGFPLRTLVNTHSDGDHWFGNQLVADRDVEIIACEALPWGSNYSFAAVLELAGEPETIGIYKPRRGEVPLWDFPDGTLHRREYAAYLLSH